MRDELSERQKREIEYHKLHAAKNIDRVTKTTGTDVVTSDHRRWWIPYWHTYTLIRSMNWQDKRILVVGCGFGEDVIRLSHLAGEVFGFDISFESIEIAKIKCDRQKKSEITLAVMTAERMCYPNNFFDGVYVRDILHHVGIVDTMNEIKRVSKDGAIVIGMEMYTHSRLQKIRNSRVVNEYIYNRMKKYVYGEEDAYITEDEKKLDEKEIHVIKNVVKFFKEEYFNITIGRLFPDRFTLLSKLERIILINNSMLGKFLGNRVVFFGKVEKR